MIRKFKPDDMPDILEIEEECFPKSSYFREMFDAFHRSGNISFFVSETKGRIDGNIAFERNGHLITMAVRKEERRKGVATSLIRAAMKDTVGPFLYLEVRRTNENAKRLYTELGGKKVKVIKGYYGNDKEKPEDAEIWILPK